MGAKPRAGSAETSLEAIGTVLGADVSAMFGKRCLKRGGKAFAAAHLGAFVVKLGGDAHADALGLSGAKLWDPSGKGRPMKAWVCVPAKHQSEWSRLGALAFKQIAN